MVMHSRYTVKCSHLQYYILSV